MADVHPASLAMLSILLLVALIGVLEMTVRYLRRRLAERRSRVSDDDLVIDLTYMHAAIRRDQELVERLRAEGALREQQLARSEQDPRSGDHARSATRG